MADKTNANIGFEKQLWDTCYKLLQFIAKWHSISGKPPKYQHYSICDTLYLNMVSR